MHAEIAREMIVRRDWKTPYVNGSPFKSSFKPLDWSIAASYKLFGVSDWAARLPIALCILAIAIAIFFFGRKLFGWNAAGFYAALFFLAWPGTFLASRDLSPAPILAVETTLIAFVLWQLLVAQKLALAKALAASAVACIVILLASMGKAALLPLAILGICWVARSIADPMRQIYSLLWIWLICALWLAAIFWYAALFDSPPHGALFWLLGGPPCALLLGGWLANKEAFAAKSSNQQVAYALSTFGLVAAAAAIFLASGPNVGLALHSRTTAVAFPRVTLLIFAAALLIGTIGNLIYRLRNNPRVANCFLAGTLAGFIIAVQVGSVLASPYFSSQILADAIRPELESADTVVIDGTYPDASSMAFYLERPVQITQPLAINAANSTIELDQLWKSSKRVFLWTNADHPFAIDGESYVVARSGGKEVLSNQPNSAGASF